MHFPSLNRRKSYKTKSCGSYYADYRIYKDEVSEDCKHRCVYCDATLDEIGGEGMHIDHFKPQKYFPELSNDPNNLVLACAKCNQLKSDWWPEKTGSDNNGAYGFVDPFDKNKLNYFSVNEKGEIDVIKPPSEYFIDLLLLNRLTRVTIRRRRILTSRAISLMDSIISEMESIHNQPIEVIKKRGPILAAALKEIKLLVI